MIPVTASLIQAMTTAEHTLGNNSFAVAGFGGEYGGYFAYQIILAHSSIGAIIALLLLFTSSNNFI
jgi:hypothetical protein